MEPEYSVLLYSKYSPISNQLQNIIQKSGINFEKIFSLQFLCIDNEKIKNRVINNPNIDVNTVPCLLLVYTNGGIEKYDGNSIFEWFEQQIYNINKPNEIEIEKLRWKKQKLREQQELENQRKLIEKIKNQQTLEKEKEIKKKEEENQNQIKYKQQILVNNQKSTTNIDSIPFENDEENNSNDRYRNRKPVGQIRNNSGNYETTKFSGEKPDSRKHKRSAIKIEDKNMDIMSKAKLLAKGREEPSSPDRFPSQK